LGGNLAVYEAKTTRLPARFQTMAGEVLG